MRTEPLAVRLGPPRGFAANRRELVRSQCSQERVPSTVSRREGCSRPSTTSSVVSEQQFMQVVPKMAERPGGIMFWYNNRVGNSINSIQSTYLWGYSKINASPPEDPGLPHLGELQLKLLNDPQVRFLGLLCESEEELSQGLAALTKKAIEFKTADYRVLASGDYRIYYQIVELMHSPGAVAH